MNRAGMFIGTPDDCYSATMSVGTLAGLDFKPLAALAAKVKYYVDMAQKANIAFDKKWDSLTTYRRGFLLHSGLGPLYPNCKKWSSFDYVNYSSYNYPMPKYYDTTNPYYLVFYDGGSAKQWFVCRGGCNKCGGVQWCKGVKCEGCVNKPKGKYPRTEIDAYWGKDWKLPK